MTVFSGSGIQRRAICDGILWKRHTTTIATKEAYHVHSLLVEVVQAGWYSFLFTSLSVRACVMILFQSASSTHVSCGRMNRTMRLRHDYVWVTWHIDEQAHS